VQQLVASFSRRGPDRAFTMVGGGKYAGGFDAHQVVVIVAVFFKRTVRPRVLAAKAVVARLDVDLRVRASELLKYGRFEVDVRR